MRRRPVEGNAAPAATIAIHGDRSSMDHTKNHDGDDGDIDNNVDGTFLYSIFKNKGSLFWDYMTNGSSILNIY